MELASLLSPDLIEVHLEAQDWEEAIRKLGKLLVQRGCVDGAYIEAVIQREREFPTGLPTEGIRVALPHTGTEHVRTSSLAIGVLEYSVPFQVMGNPAESVEVGIIFLLAIREKAGQVPALQQMMHLFQRRETLQKLATAATRQELYNRLLDDLQAVRGGVEYTG